MMKVAVQQSWLLLRGAQFKKYIPTGLDQGFRNLSITTCDVSVECFGPVRDGWKLREIGVKVRDFNAEHSRQHIGENLKRLGVPAIKRQIGQRPAGHQSFHQDSPGRVFISAHESISVESFKDCAAVPLVAGLFDYL